VSYWLIAMCITGYVLVGGCCARALPGLISDTAFRGESLLRLITVAVWPVIIAGLIVFALVGVFFGWVLEL